MALTMAMVAAARVDAQAWPVTSSPNPGALGEATVIAAFGDAVALNGRLPLNARVIAYARSGDRGLWAAGADGGVFTFGSAPFFGSAVGAASAPIVSLAATPNGDGYWLVSDSGAVFAFGAARSHGALDKVALRAPVASMASTPSGRGYWMVASDGGVFSFGDASFHGSAAALALQAPIVAMSATPTGRGYWLVAADGGVFAYGDAPFRGSMGGRPLNANVASVASTPSGSGYWMVASDGGVFSFGDAGFFGSAATSAVSASVSIIATPTGKGYWIAGDHGCDPSAMSFGDRSSGPPLPPSDVGTLVDLGLSAPGCVQRLVFTFADVPNAPASLPHWDIGYSEGPFFNTAGFPLRVSGGAALRVRLEPAFSYDFERGTPTYSGPLAFVGPEGGVIGEVRRVDDFEGVMVWALGIDAHRPFRAFALTNPRRLVIDVWTEARVAQPTPSTAIDIFYTDGTRLVARPYQLPLADRSLSTALEVLVQPVAFDPLPPGRTVTTAIPANVEVSPVQSVRVVGGVAEIDVSERFAEGGGTFSTRARLAQLVYTATQFSGVRAVRLLMNGVRVTTFGSEGFVISGPLTRADFADLAPA